MIIYLTLNVFKGLLLCMPEYIVFTCAESTLDDFTSQPCSTNGHSIEHYLHDEIVNEQFTRYVH